MFTGMGTEAFAGRASASCWPTGERFSRRSVRASDELTAQETQIARLARDFPRTPPSSRAVPQPAHLAYHLRQVLQRNSPPSVATSSSMSCRTV